MSQKRHKCTIQHGTTLFLMSDKSPQTSFPSVEARTVVFHRKSHIFPSFYGQNAIIMSAERKYVYILAI